jgi:two-component system CheB/CheR fusion protein
MSDPTSQSPPPVPVCGIGASAGGIEALQLFFRDLPTDLGLAYIVVVHSAPDHKSELPGIIGRWTAMPVVQTAGHDMKNLEPDHVYVPAPDGMLEIAEPASSTQPRGHRTSIDLFFRRLAATHGDGFAVVLSGAGSDGAVGAKSVKERGGLVLVQDPYEAAHSGMPRAAIAAGVADVVLPVRELVRRLAELARNKARIIPAVRAPETVEPIPVDEGAALNQVLEVVRARTGQEFSGYKRSTVLRRLSRRMQLSGHLTIRDYLAFVRGSAAEAKALFDDLLVSVTTFFRDPDAWESLQTQVIAPLVVHTPVRDPIRVWVPGCATGEEAYTLAILFHEEFERQRTRRELIIFASDMDPGAIALARDGVYPQAIHADVSDERLDRFFRHDGEHYQVVTEIRKHVVLAVHNLLHDPPFSRLQLISCRNVLIYFDRVRQGQVMSVFRYACRDDGFVFLGTSETADDDLFQAIDPRHRVFRVRPGADAPRSISGLLSSGGARSAAGDERRPTPSATSAELHGDALEELASPTVLLDERWNVLHLSSSAARFFQQGAGPLARRVTELVRMELRDELHALLLRASDERSAHLSPFVPVRFDSESRRVAMLAQRRTRVGASRSDVLLTFLEAGDTTGMSPGGPEPGDTPVATLSTRLHDAEQRIENMREDAYLTTEELRAANEELQSLNEEYRSTTEELETSEEELQSTNEELQTVNQELRLKLDEVSGARNDLENLIAATNVATLFLGLDLRIQRYTQQLSTIVSIKPRDLDRPIGDLRHTLDYDELEDDARRVLETGASIERHTTSQAGRAYIARLSPYRTADNRAVDGVVVTFVDVTAIKEAESALRESEQRLEQELAVIRRLHAMTLSVATETHLHDALAHVVSAALDLHGADQGHVQLFDRESQRLQIVAQRGCAVPFLERFASIAMDDPSSFGQVLRTRQIAQTADTGELDEDAPLRRLAAEAGYRAVQSTPLVSREGHLLGVLSVHFRERHRFSDRDLQLSALLGRQAADLLDTRMRQLEATASKAETSEVRALLGRLVTVQEEERRRIARNIHDHLGQSMTALRMHIESLRARSDAYPELMADMGRTERLAHELDQSIDFLTWELRPATLDRLGLSAALMDLVHGWSERFHISADYHAQGAHEAPLPTEASINLYRIVQEALHNIHKHARASRVTVLFYVRDAQAVLVVEDDGRGFTQGPSTSAGQNGGMGLLSMRERARVMGGEINVETSPGNGTTIFVRVPLGAQMATSDLREP